MPATAAPGGRRSAAARRAAPRPAAASSGRRRCRAQRPRAVVEVGLGHGRKGTSHPLVRYSLAIRKSQGSRWNGSPDVFAGSDRGRRRASRPVGRGARPGLGPRLGRGDRRRPGADQRAQRAPRPGRPSPSPTDGARPASGAAADDGPRPGGHLGRHRRARPRSPGTRPTRRASARRCSRSPTPAGAGCGRRSASSPPRAAASAARAAAASRAPSSTRAPLPRGSSGGPLVDAEGRLLGLNALRLDGGLILAVPATASVQERVQRADARARRRPRRGSAWRSHPRAPRAACAARSACPSATACWCAAVEDGSPAAGAGIERRRPARGRRTASCSTASTPSTSCSTRVAERRLARADRRARDRGARRDGRLRGDRSRGVSAVTEVPPPSTRPRPRRSTPTRAR